MAPNDTAKTAKASQDELAVISNRIAVAMAKREALVKSWTGSSSRAVPEKTQEELDAEDAAIFPNAPPYLGVGATIPANFLANDSERGQKALRAKLLTTKGLTASKARDAEEKAASARRRQRQESSDEEEGRSSLGRAKKFNNRPKQAPVVVAKLEASSDSESNERGDQIKTKKRKSDAGETEPAKKVNNNASQTNETSRAKFGNRTSTPTAFTLEEQEHQADPGPVDGVGNNEPNDTVMSEMNKTMSNGVKRTIGDNKEKEIAVNPKRNDGMDAKERRKLKKREKKKLKKLKKLREAETDVKV